MSELTLTIMRLGLLVALWLFVFSIVGVLRSDLYGTRVTSRRRADAGRKNSKVMPAAPAVPTPAGMSPPAASAAPNAPAPIQAAPPARGGFFGGRRPTAPRKLVVTEGPLLGTSLPLRPQGTLIGRSPECALVLDDDYASGRHARIFDDGGTFYVEDLGSTNGTFVDNVKITAPTPLGLGSSLRIGRTVVELSR